jgi:molybdate transport system substrate-binding protein
MGRLTATVLLALVALRGAGGAVPVDVAAAISLSEVLNELGAAHRKAGGGAIRLNLAGSNTLARQIVNGAPADVFVSADNAQMDIVERAGVVVPGSRFNVAGNRLAVLAAPGLAALARERFASAPPEIRRLAIGDPAAVPAGAYARQYLEARGLWRSYEPRVVPTTSVRAALAAVDSGGVDAAIVYSTDVAISRHAAVAFVVPFEHGPPVVYPAALLKRARAADAADRFLRFLRSPEAIAILERHGFVRLDTGTAGPRE